MPEGGNAGRHSFFLLDTHLTVGKPHIVTVAFYKPHLKHLWAMQGEKGGGVGNEPEPGQEPALT